MTENEIREMDEKNQAIEAERARDIVRGGVIRAGAWLRAHPGGCAGCEVCDPAIRRHRRNEFREDWDDPIYWGERIVPCPAWKARRAEKRGERPDRRYLTI